MKCLIVDDEQNIRIVLRMVLSELGLDVQEASGKGEALVLIRDSYFDLAVIDLRLPDGSGIDILKAIKEVTPETVVLVITAFASTETAVETMKAGAYDYVTKPFNIDELRIILKNINEKLVLEHKVRELQQYADAYQNIVGKSESMQRLFKIIEKVAPFDTHILIIGESGSGKELVAKAIHNASRRIGKRLVAINCASLPGELLESELFGYTKGAFTGAYATKRGLIEEAHEGTLFLDEIGEMPLSLQAKLLRFLEDKKVRPLGSSNEVFIDVRVVAATNRARQDLLEGGRFREDLYYRLATFEIMVPSLRDRREDIPILVDHFIRFFSIKFQKKIIKVDPAFVDYVMQHELRGNVRELKNIIEREVILSEGGNLKLSITPVSAQPAAMVPVLPENGIDLNAYLAGLEEKLLEQALVKSNGVKTRAADLLGISFREFRYRFSKIDKKGSRK